MLLPLLLFVSACAEMESQENERWQDRQPESSPPVEVAQLLDLSRVSLVIREVIESESNGQVFGFLEAPSAVRPPEEGLRRFYREREYHPAWISDEGVRGNGRLLVTFLSELDRQGIDSERYRITHIQLLLDALDDEGATDREERAGELDLLLGQAFLDSASDLRGGIFDPGPHAVRWGLEAPEAGDEGLLEEATRLEDPASILSALEPQGPYYSRLVRALAAYRGLAVAGGWAVIPGGVELILEKEGDRDRRVRFLRERLIVEGQGEEPELARWRRTSEAWREHDPTGKGGPDVFDAELVSAVRHFQGRHGLVVDGVVGPETLEALNVPVEDRIRTLLGNLDRWRWHPDAFEERHVLVNTAGFELEVVEGGEAVLSMRIVAGRPTWQTPSFRDEISYMVLNPYWYIPESIVRSSIMPRAERDPEYLASRGYEKVEGIPGVPLRQRPGPANALGTMKFMFPNPFNIYLHDTPEGGLFDRSARAFSHGCIRVEDPMALAEYLLRDDPEWDRQRLEEMTGGRRELRIELPERIPVYILYFTSWVSDDGLAHFYSDIYGRDEALEPRVAGLAGAGA